MRLVHNSKQIDRLAGGRGGELPSYPYISPLPPEMIQVLRNAQEGEYDVWRDFLNDDGGYCVIYDFADEFDYAYFGINELGDFDSFEYATGTQCSDGELWWHSCMMVNNETGIVFLFKDKLLNDTQRATMAQYLETEFPKVKE